MAVPSRALDPGTSATIASWQVCSSVSAPDGATVSRSEFRPDGWLDAPARSTVMAALLTAGRYPDVLRSTNMRDQVDETQFQVPWWYRAPFTVGRGGRTLVRVDGVMHKAQLWVNGDLVADVDEIAGAYPVSTFDVTTRVRPGLNCLALLVFPGHPMTDLSIGWVDWNPLPPDANMGVWRDVHVMRTGDVGLFDAHVRTTLSAHRADLRVTVDLENASDDARVVVVTGVITGARAADAADLVFSGAISLAAGERRDLSFDVGIDDPALWWPVGQGKQSMCRLRLVATIDSVISDVASASFGIREVTSRIVHGGGRLFSVNGRPVQVLGGGWCPDIFLRHDARRLRDELTYVVEMGLNAVRLEGKLENPEFYEIADELGVMVLPGWECCDKWESHAGTGGAAWTEHDFSVARRSMASEARLLRNHPCVIGFMIGRDFAPPERLADGYVDELVSAGWDLPIISSGSTDWNNAWASGPSDLGTTGTRAAGPSGMKMWPYDWVPPVYWYDTRVGAAVGFDSECSAGHSVPRLPSLRKMLSPDELDRLWQQPQARQYHAAPPSPFDNLGIFADALAKRYGEISSLRDFLRKAQLANYEMVRAQFEAYRSRFTAEQPATGVIYWMLNTAWPSLNWHLYDYYLDPAGAYFGAKKANAPVHALYDYATREAVVVNATAGRAGPLHLEVVVRDVNGAVLSQQSHDIEAIEPQSAYRASKIEVPSQVTTTYFVEFQMTGPDDATPSRNVYWLSTVDDVVDWEKTFWQHTPQSTFADFTMLQEVPASTLEFDARTEVAGPQFSTRVTVRNASPTGTPAVGVHASVVSLADGEPVAPIHWDDNDVTLFAHQEATLTARHAAIDVRVEIDAYNAAAPVSVRVRPQR
jgi:exo-1,4-beta-D-glucosaminidase